MAVRDSSGAADPRVARSGEGQELQSSARPRESGDPDWIPACAGMSGGTRVRVMAELVPAIYVLLSVARRQRRGCPAQGRA